MRGTWSALFYKELHEQKWRSLALATIMLGLATCCIGAALRDRTGTDDVMVYSFLMTFAGVPGSLFIAMGVAAGERVSGTLAFTRALPVAAWRVATARLVSGALAVLLPAAVTWFAVGVWIFLIGPHFAHLRIVLDSGNAMPSLQKFIGIVAASTGVMINVYLWTLAVAANQRTEIRAGFAAQATFVGLGTLVSLVAVITHDWIVGDQLTGLAFLLTPIGSLMLPMKGGILTWQVGAFLQGVVALILIGVWFVRYRRADSAPRHYAESLTSPPVATGRVELKAPRRSPLVALVWKQWRESLPFCAVGLALILGWTALWLLSADRDIGRRAHVYHGMLPAVLYETMEALVLVSGVVGIGIALLVGIGTFVAELQPGLATFWRSRPVIPSQWFWTKYITGAAAVLICLSAPLLLLMGYASALHFIMAYTSLPLPHIGLSAHFLSELAVWAWLFLFAYTVTVCLSCLVRQAVYAGIFSVGIFIAVMYLPELFELPPYLRWSAIRTVGQYAGFSLCMGVLTLTTLLIAWQSVVRDWAISRETGQALRDALRG